METLRGPDTEVIDVGDRPLLPGFIDVHAHAEVACRAAYGTVDCRAPECSTVEEVLQALRDRHRRGGRDRLDRRAGEPLLRPQAARGAAADARGARPASRPTCGIALRAGGHITVLNSKGLELAGIDRDREAPTHSITGKPIIERDDDREPTGVVKEMDNVLPLPPQTAAVVREALRTGIHTLFTRHGVTTIGEISETVEGLSAMDALARERALGARIRAYLWAPGTVSLEQALRLAPPPAADRGRRARRRARA